MYVTFFAVSIFALLNKKSYVQSNFFKFFPNFSFHFHPHDFFNQFFDPCLNDQTWSKDQKIKKIDFWGSDLIDDQLIKKTLTALIQMVRSGDFCSDDFRYGLSTHSRFPMNCCTRIRNHTHNLILFSYILNTIFYKNRS